MKKLSRRILIVEDDPDLLEALERQFTKRTPDLEITSVRDGLSALEVAYTVKPDLILLDLFIPKLKGLEMLKQLRGNDWGKTVRVVVLTNFDETGFLQEAVQLGVSDFLVKAHYRLEQVVERVQTILREPQLEPAK